MLVSSGELPATLLGRQEEKKKLKKLSAGVHLCSHSQEPLGLQRGKAPPTIIFATGRKIFGGAEEDGAAQSSTVGGTCTPATVSV